MSEGPMEIAGLLTLPSGLVIANEAITVYDENTYTPAVGGVGSNPTVTYTSRSGDYRLLNKGCHVQTNIKINTISGGSGITYFTLPFTAHSAGVQVLSAYWYDASAAIYYPCVLRILASNSLGYIIPGGGTFISSGTLGASDEIGYGGFYITA